MSLLCVGTALQAACMEPFNAMDVPSGPEYSQKLSAGAGTVSVVWHHNGWALLILASVDNKFERPQ